MRGPQGPQGPQGPTGDVAGVHVFHHIASSRKQDKSRPSHLLAQISSNESDEAAEPGDNDIERRLNSLTTKMDALKRLLQRRIIKNQ